MVTASISLRAWPLDRDNWPLLDAAPGHFARDKAPSVTALWTPVRVSAKALAKTCQTLAPRHKNVNSLKNANPVISLVKYSNLASRATDRHLECEPYAWLLEHV